jgi:hypothetical protein
MMTRYDNKLFDPPAPLATVKIRITGNGDAVPDVLMLLDSGADVTLIPRSAVVTLGITINPEVSYELMGFDGSISIARAVRLDLIFLRQIFRGQYLLIDQDWGVLGRDILNYVSLVFDGPHLTWSEQK